MLEGCIGIPVLRCKEIVVVVVESLKLSEHNCPTAQAAPARHTNQKCSIGAIPTREVLVRGAAIRPWAPSAVG